MKKRTKVATKTKTQVHTKILAVIAVGVAAAIIGSFAMTLMPHFRSLTFAKVADSNTTLTPGIMEVLRFTVTADNYRNRISNHTLSGRINSNFDTNGYRIELYDSTGRVISSTTMKHNSFVFPFIYVFRNGETPTFYVKADLTRGARDGSYFQLTLGNYLESPPQTDPLNTIGLPIVGNTYIRGR